MLSVVATIYRDTCISKYWDVWRDGCYSVYNELDGFVFRERTGLYKA